VNTLLLPNIDCASIPRVHAMMDQWPDRCLGMMGLHPCHVKADSMEQELTAIEDALRNSGRRYVAVGEIGFDLYWDKTTLAIQHKAFERQVAWAKELGLPIVIHVREAFDALFEAMDRLNDDRLSGVVHCFTGNLEQAQRVMAYGKFYLGIGGVATYKNGGLDAVLPHVNRDRVILETDSPYLAPVPYRGKRNESSYTAVVAQRVADLWECPVDDVAATTTANAKRLFAL
jgi:TatD DNase family protein